MKILGIDKTTCFLIETDESEYPFYRRNGPYIWENLMGESWETVFSGEDELENAFIEWMKNENPHN